MPKEPAYHSGLSTLGRLPSSLEPGFAPGEVIGLFACRIQHEFADFRVAGEHGLGVVQRLGGHLAGMIHAHQGRGLALFVGGQGGVGLLGLAEPGGGAAGTGRPAAGGASRARRARSAAEIKVSREGPLAMGAIIGPVQVPNPLGHQEFCKGMGALSTLAPLFPGARQSDHAESFGGDVWAFRWLEF